MANYVSNYTGQQIDTILTKADTIPSPTAQDVNKILSVGQNGIEWIENNGGSNSSELPEYDLAESGKILAVTSENGEPELTWENYTPIPDAKNKQGKILKVTNDNGTLAWQTENTGIPSYSDSDEGKVLGILNYAATWITNKGNGSSSSLTPNSEEGLLATVYNNESHEYELNWIEKIPTYDSNDLGKILAISSNEHMEWKNFKEFLLPPTDQMSVLTANNTGNLYWRSYQDIVSDGINSNGYGLVAYTSSSGVTTQNIDEVLQGVPDIDSDELERITSYGNMLCYCSEPVYSVRWINNPLPKITNGDEGKILIVQNGTFVLVDPATVLN